MGVLTCHSQRYDLLQSLTLLLIDRQSRSPLASHLHERAGSLRLPFTLAFRLAMVNAHRR